MSSTQSKYMSSITTYGNITHTIFLDGTQVWCDEEMRFHQEVENDAECSPKPAVIWSDGTQEWYWHGELHRESKYDLPSIIYISGTLMWYCHGERHRDTKDKCGRTLPAVVWSDGLKEWWYRGKRHQDIEDGVYDMAVLYPDGDREWYVNGIKLTEDQVRIAVKHKIWQEEEITNLFQWLPIEMNVITNAIICL